jgi:hypothetical protein
MARKPASKIIRRRIRFAPDPGTIAYLNFDAGALKAQTLCGLVLNESLTGCALVLMSETKLKEEMTCVCRVGQLPDTAAIVRWVKLLEANLYKIGLEYKL